MFRIICNMGSLVRPLRNVTATYINISTTCPCLDIQRKITTNLISRCNPKKRICFSENISCRCRKISTREERLNIQNRNTMYYSVAFVIFVGGCTYCSVLLYRLYCQTTGKGGQAVQVEASEKIANMKPVTDRRVTVNFNADVNSTMRWNFKPQQPFIKVVPGETALAFYTALNPTSKTVTGVATYNVVPYEAGKYFNKIQCFCFEEQQLNPNEEVDMPVFFYLDPEYAEDPRLENVHDIVLSYTFFEAKKGIQLPRPAFM